MIQVKPTFCPLLKGDNDATQCTQPVTVYFFDNVCNHPHFGGCKRYAEIAGKLKPPFQWLQHKAVEVGGRIKENEDRR